MAEEYFAPRADNDLQVAFERRRTGVNDPARQVAAELQNISDALLEVLKHLRMIKNKLGK